MRKTTTNICDLFVLHICWASIWERESNTHWSETRCQTQSQTSINQHFLIFWLSYHLTHALSCFSGLRKLMMVKCAPLQILANIHIDTHKYTHMHKKKTEQYSILASIKCWVVTFFSDLKLNLFRIKEYRIKYFILRIKVIQVYNNTRVSKWWQNYNFCVNFPFKVKSWLTFCVYWHIWTQKDRYAWIRG